MDLRDRRDKPTGHEHGLAREPGGVSPSRPRPLARRCRRDACEPRHLLVHLEDHELLVALDQSFRVAALHAIRDAAEDYEFLSVQ